MSIFRNTFTKEVQEQLTKRQEIVKARTPKSVQLLNSHAPWVRMTSGVDTLNLNTNEFDNTLAKQNILLGGALDSNKKLRYSVGSTGNEAYSNRTLSGNTYQRGLRPMPGITSVDVKSKSAYGSLREVTVNFTCHDIKQLEDLEVLYMRPGYTVLVEWGWLPYLSNDGNLVTNLDFYDDVIDGKKDFQTVLLELFKKSKTHSGNYDAVYGKVQNYSWQARMDGGYDCTTTIITMGEVLESIKVNTTPFNIKKIVNDRGVIFKDSKNPETLKDYYSQNYLAGLLYEFIQHSIETKNKYPSSNTVATKSFDQKYKNTYYGWVMEYKTTNGTSTKEGSTYKTYLTLDSVLDLINNYIILGAGTDEKNLLPFVKLSTYSNDDTPEPLLCLSHPLQVSVDTNVCIITNNLFANGVDIKAQQANLGANNGSPTAYETSATETYKQYKIYLSNSSALPDLPKKIANQILKDIGISIASDRNNAEQNAKLYLASYLKASGGSGLGALKKAFDSIAEEYTDIDNDYKNAVNTVSNTLLNSDTKAIIKDNADKDKVAQDLASGNPVSFNKVDYLAKMDSSSGTKKFQTENEYGIIGNIYINLEKLLELATNSNRTTSEKKEIKLYDFIKSILREIQESTGNINNFDIHIDPIDNIARIIDINYVDKTDRTKAFDNAFQLEVANTSGIVKSYTLQSQIFPEQSSIVAIGAQIKGGGEQGSDNNTLLSFNKGIQDRIIPVKLDQNNPITTVSEQDKINNVIESILILQEYFFPPQSPVNKTGVGANTDLSNKYKNALKDIIKYIQGITNANSKNRSIIPVKLSLTMDGIGGLVIGHLFKFPNDLLPQGYKFTNKDKGVKLLQTVIGLGHKIDNTGWTTTIDAYNMVLNEPEGNLDWNSLVSKSNGRTLISLVNVNIPVATTGFNKDKISIAIKFFKSKGYSDIQVSAIVGGLLQESGLNPFLTNSIGAYGIAQWLGDRLVALKKYKNGWNNLNVQLEFLYYELTSSEARVNNLLKRSDTLEKAIAAFAAFERYKGISLEGGVTFEEVVAATETGNRIGYARDVYNRIQAKEF